MACWRGLGARVGVCFVCVVWTGAVYVRALGGSHADAVATRARVVILRGIFVTVQYCTVLYSKSKKPLLQYNIYNKNPNLIQYIYI